MKLLCASKRAFIFLRNVSLFNQNVRKNFLISVNEGSGIVQQQKRNVLFKMNNKTPNRVVGFYVL